MHAVKLLSCSLLAVALPSVSYASDAVPIVASEEELPVSTQAAKSIPVISPAEMMAEVASPVSTQAKDLQSDTPLSPLQLPPTKLHNLETANQLEQGAVQGEAGFLQVLPLDDSVSGTGLQTYQIDVDWGVTDDLQLGFTGDIFDDYVKCPAREQCGDFTTATYGAKLKYRLINQSRWAVGVAGTAQLMNVSASAGTFTNRASTRLNAVTPVGALQFPITYKASANLQLHLTPGVVLFPDTVKGADFFGTFVNIGTGFSWQASPRLNLFANIQAPLGPGGNSFSAKDRSIYRRLLWAVGVDYALNPRMAAEVYATNSFGTTPTTGLLAFIPDGDDLLLGIRFKHVIDWGRRYAADFANRPIVELSERDRSLLFDGFTLATPQTLATGTFQARGGLGTNGSSSFALAYGLTNDAQLELNVDQFGGSDRLSGAEISGPGVKIGGAIKLRFLNQRRGDLLSLGFKLAAISEAAFQGNSLNGTIYAEVPIAYQLSPQTSISINPKGAFFGKVSRTGVGIGINQALGENLQFIGEYTPIFDGTRDVWSTGLRFLPSSKLGIDIFAGNAIGQSGLGTVTAESGTNIGFSVNWGI
ncbi:DUF5777 family beta-barrel protein [Fortiea contorta]|uniref:DUF5777 family beta-barrel protein n=1 Tax=Fortiea contorta TaxID=1892405 RepID=UPI000346FB0A|nr:DUF5777 family beta-barrel protein [Fortiea contorta]